MKNKYGKQCCYCGCYVSAGEGRCWWWEESKRWYVACEDCFQEKKKSAGIKDKGKRGHQLPYFFASSQ